MKNAKNENRKLPEVGQTVRWSSQSKGHHTRKEGVVIAVVPAGVSPCRPTGLRALGAGLGYSRRHPSVLVQVGNVCYWPRVCHLRVVKPKACRQAEKPCP